jgi:transketolase
MLREKMDKLTEAIKKTRKRLIDMHFDSGIGHIGGNLSALDILMVLFHTVLGAQDTFILSKGHAAGALYATLWSIGRLKDEDLLGFHRDDTKLSGHPAPDFLPEIPFSTGSLGHGLSLAAGIALGKTLQKQPGRVFCLLSDGEMQEGSTWEALIFLAHRLVAPLTVFIDANGLQGFGTTKEVSGLQLTAEKFRNFGLAAEEIDGHDVNAIAAACERSNSGTKIYIAHTCKGCGISFMENRMEWHYLPMTEEQYKQALKELESV